MFASIKALLTGESNPSLVPDRQGEPRLAVATLLVEMAVMDGDFDEAERTCVQTLLTKRFSLSKEELAALMANATRKSESSAELYGFTRTLKDRFSYEERAEMIEMLWEVAYADGTLDPHEDSLIRRVAGLLYVEDRDSGRARKKVLEARARGGLPTDRGTS